MRQKTLRMLVLAAALGLSYQAHAAGTIYTWSGAISNDATDAGNWTPGLPNYGNSSSTGTNLLFDSTASTTNTSPNLDGITANIDGIVFAAGAPAETFTGTGYWQPQNTLFISIANNSSNTQTFNNADIGAYNFTSANGKQVDAETADIVINGIFHPGTDLTGRGTSLGGAHDIYLQQVSGGSAATTAQMFYNGSGRLVLADSNGTGSYNGNITITSGIILATNSNSFGTTTGITTVTGATTGTGAVELQGGITVPESFTLASRTAAGNATLPHLVSLSGSNTITGNFGNSSGNGSVTIESRGTGGGDSLEIAGNINHNGSGTVCLLNLSGAGNGLFSGNITANQGNFDVVKNDGGTWTLSGTGNNVDGNYVVHGGTLVLAAVSGNHGVHYTVDSGTKLVIDSTNMSEDVSYAISGTLGGVGTIHGATSISGGTLAPGDSPGTLSMGDLTVSGATLAYELDAINHAVGSGINDLTIAGAVDLTGGATLNVTPQNGTTLTLGTYELIDYTGLLTGSASNITLGSVPLPVGYTASIQIDSDSVNLVVVPAGVPGDFNGNGVVDAADYVVWRKNFPNNSGTATVSMGDGNGDGNVTSADYDIWRAKFGTGSGSGSGSGVGASSAVPEPATCGLLALCALLGLLGGRPRRAVTAST